MPPVLAELGVVQLAQLYPALEQASVLNRTFGCVRVVWNRTLAWRHQRYDGEQVKTNFTQANAYLTAMKATGDLAWLNEVSSVPLQQAIRHQQVAYTNFFAKRARYPRFKSRAGRQSAEYTRSGFRFRDGRLWLAKMDAPLAFTWSWPDIDPASIEPSTVTVSRDPCGRWYVSLAVEMAGPGQLPATGAVAGIDLGIKDFAVTSGGDKIPNPRTREARARDGGQHVGRPGRLGQRNEPADAQADGAVAVTVALFLVLAIFLPVLLTVLADLRAMLVDLQPTLQLLGPAVLLGCRVPLLLLLVQRRKLTLEGVITWPGLLIGIGHSLPPMLDGGSGERPMLAG